MSLVVNIKVVPSSGRQKCVLDKSGSIKCFLKSPAEKGKANDELIKFVSKNLNLTKNNVVIMLGETSRNKRIKINSEITLKQFLFALNIEQQMTIDG